MSNQSKKQTFLAGTAILAAAVAAVKLIGFFYKIPLNNILGAEGKTYFNTAYEIYNVLLTVSTAGLPLAISKLTSEAHAQGRENEKRKIFRTAIWLFFGLGLAGALLMFFGADALANFQNNEAAYWPIRALAPAVFCVCLLACMRGYTQGQGNMKPTAISQVLEALFETGHRSAAGVVCTAHRHEPGDGRRRGHPGRHGGHGGLHAVLVGYLTKHRNRTQSLDVPPAAAI